MATYRHWINRRRRPAERRIRPLLSQAERPLPLLTRAHVQGSPPVLSPSCYGAPRCTSPRRLASASSYVRCCVNRRPPSHTAPRSPSSRNVRGTWHLVGACGIDTRRTACAGCSWPRLPGCGAAARVIWAVSTDGEAAYCARAACGIDQRQPSRRGTRANVGAGHRCTSHRPMAALACNCGCPQCSAAARGVCV